MFTAQTLIAIAVAVGVAVAWTIALVIAGTIWQRDQARAAKAARDVTIPARADDTRELVLRWQRAPHQHPEGRRQMAPPLWICLPNAALFSPDVRVAAPNDRCQRAGAGGSGDRHVGRR